ncbi:aminotransferase-like domain-containing protein [Flavisphingomonas formosensis]|uniref:aminotransferase-like domain-containing protein n=1 Tax=Flavisphingomonas formosensis TaxID=861534 RepID=UPI0012F8EB7C|nr:PLP-dependent aminotransferase family protein [Sphingomonas formosensis]
MAVTSVLALRSTLAGDGPPLFFPDPDVPAIFNFDQGLAAPETFPREDLVRIAKLVLDRDGPEVLDYFDPATGYEELVYGYKGLRSEIAKRIQRTQKRTIDPLGIILTSGSVQGIALAIAGYVNAGDVVIVEAASFPYALRYMAMAGAEVRTVPVDDGGMDVDAVETLLSDIAGEGKRVKMVYTIPTFQTPTGTVLSAPRRQKLVDLAAKHGFLILEDNVYGDLRFAGEPLPTLLELDRAGLVLQCGSFSKIVAPALRLGWIAGTDEAIAGLAAVRQDLGVGQWLARVMTQYLAEGLLEPHLERANQVYKSKAETAVRAMRRYCGDYVSFREPQGSFYLWVEIDERVDWETAARMAEREGIFFRPGERFMGDTGGRQYLRLAYSHVSEDVIEQGIATLGGIIARCVRAAA